MKIEDFTKYLESFERFLNRMELSDHKKQVILQEFNYTILNIIRESEVLGFKEGLDTWDKTIRELEEKRGN